LKVIKHELRQSTERVWETWTVRGQGNAGGGWNYPKRGSRWWRDETGTPPKPNGYISKYVWS
jgi:hypothetical protein